MTIRTLLRNLVILAIPFSMEAFYWDLAPRVAYYFPVGDAAKDAFPDGSTSYQLQTSFHFDDPWRCMPWNVWANVSYIQPQEHSFQIYERRNQRNHHRFDQNFEGDLHRIHHDQQRLELNVRSKTYLLPLSLGLKYNWSFCENWDVYLGLGGTLTYLHIDNRLSDIQPLAKLEPANNFVRLRPDLDESSGKRSHRKGHSFHLDKHSSDHQLGFIVKSGFEWNICNGVFMDLFIDYYYSSFHVGRGKRGPKHCCNSDFSSRSHSHSHSHDDIFDDFDHKNRDEEKGKRRKLNMSGFFIGGGFGAAY